MLDRLEDLGRVCPVRWHVVQHPEGLKVIGLISEKSAMADIASTQGIRDHTDNESTRDGEPK
ncbi:MAG: hypothetical protein QOI46_6026 [Alphaproteobacteria bacterium]|nr:hypothetical protein [Alphaproteobacteria bacterium]